MGATLIVATLGMGGLLAVRAQTRNIDSATRSAAARQHALSAIELGIQEIASNANWRTAHKNDTNGIWYNNKPLGNGTYTLKVVNPLGALDRSATDPVTLTATGKANNGIEQQLVQVTLVPQITPLSSVQTAMTVNGFINFDNATVGATNAIVASNSFIWATAPVYARLEAVNWIFSSQTYGPAAVSGADSRTLPDPTTAFDYYIAKGTAIDINSLPLSGTRQLVNKVLSPATNPYGTGQTNADGIYVINCGGQSITISRFRMVGTLVLINPGSGSSLQNQVNFAPVTENFPCLMIQGDFDFRPNSSDLTESAGVNFNPSGTSPPETASPFPWTGGSYNNTTADSYPNEITGLVYVSGDLITSGSPKFGQIIVNGAAAPDGNLKLSYDPVYYNSPPPGFYTLKMVPAPGTWLQTTN